MPKQSLDRVSGATPFREEQKLTKKEHYNEALYDYSLGNGVQMRKPFEHGFGRTEQLAEKEEMNFDETPKKWMRIDEKIQDQISTELKKNHLLDASRIEVEIHQGIVTLKGFVPDRSTKKEAEHCIENISGVVDIFNELKLRGL